MSQKTQKIEILKMKDESTEGLRIHKDNLFDLPMRLLVIGKSQLSGKTNFVGNLLLRPYGKDDKSGQEFYKNDFEGRNIYIVCPSTLVDAKWKTIIEGKSIPDGNVFTKYDEEELEHLYSRLEEQFAKYKEHSLIIMDDCSFGGDLKSKIHGVLAKFACNGRHHFISIVVTAQKYSDISTTLRENASGMILYNCSQKQLELIYNDVGLTSKKDFCDLFRRCTFQPHTFMAVNYSNPPDRRFLDTNFSPV